MCLRKNFGSRLKFMRKLRGLSQEQLAEKIEISPKNLSKIEIGQTFPTPENIEKIAKYLNITVDALFSFDNYEDVAKLKKDIISRLRKMDNKNIVLVHRFLGIIE